VREVIGKSAWLIVAVAMAIMSSAQGATHSLGRLVDAVVRDGQDGQLPAHLSDVLGVSTLAQKTAVKQAVIRDGYRVRTFNVCSVNRDNLVILTYDEQSRSTRAYLVSVTGTLRKAVYYQAGERANERSLADAGSDFAAEIKFWTDFSERSSRVGAN
jgi:hypothetical protein